MHKLVGIRGVRPAPVSFLKKASASAKNWVWYRRGFAQGLLWLDEGDTDKRFREMQFTSVISEISAYKMVDGKKLSFLCLSTLAYSMH